MDLTLEGYLRLYSSLDLAIVPTTADRVPLVKWKEDYLDKGVRPAWTELENWFVAPKTKNPAAVICGKLSNGLVGLDFEHEQNYIDFFTPEGTKKLESTTLVQNTPHGGVHVFMREIYGEVPSRAQKLTIDPPFDLLGEGGLMHVAPSQINHLLCSKDKHDCPHQGLGTYTMRGTSFDVTDQNQILDGVLKRIEALGWKKNVKATQSLEEFKRTVLGGAPSGMRNQRLFEVARKLIFDFGFDLDVAYAELENINRRCKPPLPERELKTLFTSAKNYPTTRRNAGEFDPGESA